MRILLCSILFLCYSFVVYAQTDSIRTTIQLKEIYVVGDKNAAKLCEAKQYSTGTKLLSADSVSLALLRYGSLSDYIIQHTPIFIKESGSGMLATLSLRGTASSHTAVNWNGLTINSLTMGQMDFNQLPLFLFDEVALHLGGESALHGNGSIGGSILLGSNTRYKKIFSLEAQQTSGSFGYSFSGIKCKVGNEVIQSKTAILFNRSDNNFPFPVSDFEGTHTEIQQHAAYYNYSLLQEIFTKLSPRDELSAHVWHSYYFREIQPSIQNNTDESQYDEISTRTTRLVFNYKHEGTIKWGANASYVDDYQLNFSDIIASRSLTFAPEAEKRWRKFLLKLGGNVQYIVPQVYSYQDGVDETRFDLFILSRYSPCQSLDINLNARQGMVTGITVPFTPSAGFSWRLLQQVGHALLLRGSVSRSFKVPTLNDRYWGGLDNRYLFPEDGFNREISLDYGLNLSDYSLQLGTNGYINTVQNWIMWMPRGDIWKPQNIAKVEAKGIEVSTKQNYKWDKNELQLVCNYAYTLTTILEGFNEMQVFTGNQMPLLPKHSATALLKIEHDNRYLLQLNANYVGERTTSNLFDVMYDYCLLNASAGYTFRWNKNTMNVLLQVNNVLNAVYQNMPYKAMPGRNMLFTVKYKWN